MVDILSARVYLVNTLTDKKEDSMLTIDQIKAKLADRQTSKVAEATGLSRQTIYEIKRGIQTNPTHETLKRLSDYLEERP